MRLLRMTGLVVAALLMGIAPTDQVHHFIPTSEVVRVASMAARDEGYNPNIEGTFLDELRTQDGKEPYPGYASIGLFHNGHLVKSYSIRIATGDVVDATDCRIFRYPDLLRLKNRILKAFNSKEVSREDIALEIGCDELQRVS
jgi:hypothetical protein